MNRFLTTCIALVSLLAAVTVSAQERILSYHSDIEIAVDGSMIVSETIQVRAEGDQIRRGIYRDFPTRYSDRFGNDYVVDFEVLGVTRNNSQEPFRRESRGNGVRVYIGDADVTLPPGEYDYTIRYHTDRQLGFFEDHDELYWNVTGNGWAFQIEQASATVSLPAQVPASDFSITGFTGPFGASGDAFAANVNDGGAAIETTAPLGPGEGLTLVMSWPKGVVTEPGVLQKLGYVLGDNLGLLLSLLALLASFAYLYKTWDRVGRDPDAGVIFPHYDAPKGYSPASARYISKMAYDSKAFTAALINLAVKGHLTIKKEGKEYTLDKKTSDQVLAPGEKVLLEKLFRDGDTLVLEKENHATISTAMTKHRSALRKDYLNIYFSKNWALLLPSFIGSLLVLAIIALSGTMVAMVAVIYAVIVIMHIVFLYLMKAPSIKGRFLMDKLEGFKMYLEVAEQEDLNLRNPPDKTPELFERYLPFAIALGVEQAWAEQFAEVFKALEAQGTNAGHGYHPVWYYGAFHSSHLNDFTDSISNSMATAISSSATAPGSTSGTGGGGFSGGGGGGGGGGGW